METSTSKTNRKAILQAIGILCLSFLLICTTAITASLQLIGKMFPDVPYSSITLLETSPSFSGIVFCLISGVIAGKKVRFRTLGIIGMGGYIIFGALPFFLSDFTAILICRLLMGAFMGLMMPLGNALIILTLPAEMVSTMVGLNVVVQNIGILILQNVANALVKVSTPYVWLCYLIGIIPFLGVLFLLKEPAAKEQSKETQTVAEKQKMPSILWPLGVLLLLFCMFFMVSSSGASEVVIGEGIGTVDDVTTIFNVNTIVALLCGMAFGTIYKFTKKLTVYIGFVLSAVGLLIFSLATSIPMMTVCMAVLAIGYSLCNSAFMMEINGAVPPAIIASGTAVLASMASLGVAFASNWYDFVQNLFGIQSMRLVMYVSVGGIVLVGVLHGLLQKKLNKACEENAANADYPFSD